MDKVLDDIRAEREKQDAKWGVQTHRDGTGPESYVLDHCPLKSQELADAAREQTDRYAKVGDVTFSDIFLEEVFEAMAEADRARLRKELVQAAAVAVAWIENIDREEKENERKSRDT